MTKPMEMLAEHTGSPEGTTGWSAFIAAYEHLVWLGQRGFHAASVELFDDGSGQFMIPLTDAPEDGDEVLDAFHARLGKCEYSVAEPADDPDGKVMAVFAFDHALRRLVM